MWIPILLIVSIVVILLFIDSRKPPNFPPGPRWLPILGSLIEVQKVRVNCGLLVKTVHYLAKQYKTNLLGIRVGTDRIVITGDVESSKQMLLNEDIDGRPKGIFYILRTWGQRKGIVLTDEDLWKDQRKFILRHLKDFGYGRRGMQDISKTEAEHLLKDVRDRCRSNNNNSAIIQVNELFGTYILNTLWMMMAGIRYSKEDAELNKLQNLLSELFANIDMMGTLFGHFPLLRFIAPEKTGYNRYVHTHERIWDFLRNEINNHKRRFKPENEDRDFMDAYIRVVKDIEGPSFYTEAQLMAICMDLFMAGLETSNKSMGFGFLNILREQEVQKKAQQEIDKVIGRDRLPAIDDRPNMPYNEAMCMESIRHFLGNSFGIPHRAIKDTDLCGYRIPKDTTVIANYYDILMNEDYFKDAKAFRPERFIVNGKVIVPEGYYPFGLGKHRCIGESLAKCNIFLFTTTLLQSYDFKLVPGDSMPSSDPVDGATPSVQPFRALVIPRQR